MVLFYGKDFNFFFNICKGEHGHPIPQEQDGGIEPPIRCIWDLEAF